MRLCWIATGLFVAVCLFGPGSAVAQGSPDPGAILSPFIDSLRHDGPVSSDSVWDTLRRRGLPLVEEDARASDREVVTFVFRGDSTTRNVVLVTPLTLVDFSSGIMDRLGTAPIWYRSIVLPTDARFLYRFAPNDNLIPFEKDPNMGARFRTMQRDSLNPKIFDYGPFGQMSILELKDAPSDSLIRRRSDVPRGSVSHFTVSSHALGQDRTIAVYTPPGYSAAARQRFATLVLSDGESYQSLIPTRTILDNMIADGTITPVIAVFVDTPAATREHDLNCTSSWDTFFVKELVPWVDARYRTLRGPRHRIVGGFSLGGLAAACVAIRNPTTFGNVLAQSGSFYRGLDGGDPEWVSRTLARERRLPLRFSFSIGRYETAAIPSRNPSMLMASRDLRDVLVASGYDIRYEELDSGHEHVAWRAVFGDALRFLLRPW